VLFGKYEWNKRLSSSVSELDQMSYEQRIEVEGGQPGWWTRDDLCELPLLVIRCSAWKDVGSALEAITCK